MNIKNSLLEIVLYERSTIQNGQQYFHYVHNRWLSIGLVVLGRLEYVIEQFIDRLFTVF